MRGKYSPTVTAAYMADQAWHTKHRDPDEPVYDRDGFDSYGYDKDEVDRAGNPESDYFMGWYDEYDNYHDDNAAYDNALESWGFDGVRPVARK